MSSPFISNVPFCEVEELALSLKLVYIHIFLAKDNRNMRRKKNESNPIPRLAKRSQRVGRGGVLGPPLQETNCLTRGRGGPGGPQKVAESILFSAPGADFF